MKTREGPSLGFTVTDWEMVDGVRIIKDVELHYVSHDPSGTKGSLVRIRRPWGDAESAIDIEPAYDLSENRTS